MSGEQPNPTSLTAEGTNDSSAPASTNLPYVYIRADDPVGSRGDRQPPARYYGREGTPHPNPLYRRLSQPARSTPNQSAPIAGNPSAANQGSEATTAAPQGRVVMVSRVPDYYLATGDYAKHTALMVSSASIMFPVEEIEEEDAVAAPAPQQMYKHDIEAAKILVNISTRDCAEYNERNGL